MAKRNTIMGGAEMAKPKEQKQPIEIPLPESTRERITKWRDSTNREIERIRKEFEHEVGKVCVTLMEFNGYNTERYAYRLTADLKLYVDEQEPK